MCISKRNHFFLNIDLPYRRLPNKENNLPNDVIIEESFVRSMKADTDADLNIIDKQKSI